MAGLDFTQEQYNAGSNHGYYQHIILSDLINNFMVSETGEGMILQNANRTQVEYHAQRAVQEFSYDTLRTVKSFETELEGSLNVIIPQDAVGIISVFWSDDSGYLHPLTHRRYSGNPDAPLQDSEGNYLYDSEGDFMYADMSNTLRLFDNRTQSVTADAFYNYYAGSFENDELYDRYYSYYGRRFGSDPTQTNINGTYLYDEERGVIYIDNALSDSTIVIDYVSDGLGDDITQIRVHKFAEEGIYGYIRHKLIMNMLNLPLYEKQMAKKEYMAAKRRAKHRLSTLNPVQIAEAMRGKYKWIKH